MPSIRFCHYRLALEAPAVMTRLGGDPNAAETLGYIPGSAMRGVLAARLAPNTPRFDDLILSGRLCYLNAYPCVEEQRALPVPLSWRCEKRAAVVNRAVLHYDMASPGFVLPQAELKSPWWPYVTGYGPGPAGCRPALEGNTHIAQDRERGTPGVAGTLYGYQALRGNQDFAGAIGIRADSDAEAEALAAAMRTLVGEGPVYLGRSKAAQYGGRASLQWATTLSADEMPSGHPMHARRQQKDLAAGDHFILLLTSDYVGRASGTGQPDGWALQAEVERALPVRVKDRFWGSVLCGGYVRAWGLPQPQHHAIAAGGVLVLKAEGGIAADELRAIERRGLGERRIDGFGRCVFVPPGPARLQVTEAPPAATDTPRLAPGDWPPELSLLQRRLALQVLEPTVQQFASLLADAAAQHGKAPLPSSSILGRLRLALRSGSGSPSDALARLKHVAQHIDCRDRSRLRCPVDGKRLSDWLQWVCDWDREATLARVGGPISRVALLGVDSARASLEADDVSQLQVRYLDTFLAVLSRQVRKESDG